MEGKACAKAPGQEHTRYVQEQQEGPVATGDSLGHDLREVTEGDRKPLQDCDLMGPCFSVPSWLQC